MYYKRRIRKEHIRPASQRYIYEFYDAYENGFDTDCVFDLEDEYIVIHHTGRSVYKYYPFSLPYKIEGNKVYSYINKDEWIPIGILSQEEIETIQGNDSKLMLYQGIYKEVEEDYVETVEDEPYFCFLVKMDQAQEKIQLTL